MSTDADQAELPIWKPPLRYPFKLRVNDYVRLEGKLGRVIRVTESAAVVLVNQPPREFTTLFDPNRMPGQKRAVLDWPYVEALRLDEAMNPLALMVTGLYGKTLPPQNGAPLRMVMPWKETLLDNLLLFGATPKGEQRDTSLERMHC